ncbi:VATG1 ATPase, partial [Polyodon spathula]|nr:VATG1 ATPase [Polyodon spathula]
MASQSQGIQQLLQAEKRAADKVAEARKRKNRRLKQAKEEAQAEIEQYRLQREKEFKTKEEAVRFIPFLSCPLN